MSQPIIADNKPKKVKLKKGESYFCACGKSKKQPYCDGSHVGTDFSPKKFKVEKESEAWLCMCKYSKNPPYCDGTHKQFSHEQVGKEGPLIENKEVAPKANPTPEEPTVAFIHQLASKGLKEFGHHGPMAAMGVPRNQLDRKPLMEDVPVQTDLVIGPEAKRPLKLKIPLFVSDMSFGALSEEAKLAMAKGAELVGTGICSGEGGMLCEEQEANSRYFYELASAKFGFKEELLSRVQAFHFKGGQGAKTGTGGHLPASKNIGKISQVRGIPEGEAAVSPPTFPDLSTPQDFAKFGDRVREITGGIPIGFKLSANHIEKDIEFALQAGADYIILDGRGGGTGAAPLLFRDHISVPTIPALARARAYLDKQSASGRVTLIITGGLRVPSDFIKALALGADGVAIANSAMQSIGCIAARICHTNQCPAGIATQNPDLRKRIDVTKAAQQLANFLNASTELMQVMARACGHRHLKDFNRKDIATWHKELASLAGIPFSGLE